MRQYELLKKIINKKKKLKQAFTWNSSEEFDGVPVTVETQLSMSHGAVRHKGPSGHFVPTLVAVDSHHTSRLVSCAFGCLAGRCVTFQITHCHKPFHFYFLKVCLDYRLLLSVRGMEMMTPLPVPIHRRLQEMVSAVILTKEKPNLPVPERRHTEKVNGLALTYKDQQPCLVRHS